MIKGLSKEFQEIFEQVCLDTDLAVQTFFRIKDMNGKIVPFRYNRAQRLHKERSTEADYVLKARKVGVSSRRFARDIWRVATEPGHHRILLAQSDDDVKKILEEKIKPMIENCRIPLGLTPMSDGFYSKEMKSRYYIGTAGAKRFGRGSDITGGHFTEYAHWAKPDVMAGVEEGLVTNADLLIETTANGHNFAKIDWDRAKRGENRYRSIFLPWMVHESYWLDPKDLGPISEEERRLMDAFKMSAGQIAWRRAKINSMRDPALFPQEYPETDDQAFISSGRPVFDWLSTARARNLASDPRRTGYLIRNQSRIEFRDDQYGKINVWRNPEAGHVYAIGGDVAEGIDGGAYSAGFVFDIGDSEQVAEWHGHIAPDLYGDELQILAAWYNHAIIIPESWPGPGGTTTARLEQLKARLWKDSEGEMWQTTAKSKPLMILSLAGAVRDQEITLRSPQLFDEIQSFIYDEKGHMVPSLGNFSDRIIAAALAWYCTRDIAGRVDYYKPPRLGEMPRAFGGGTSAPKFKGGYGVRPE